MISEGSCDTEDSVFPQLCYIFWELLQLLQIRSLPPFL